MSEERFASFAGDAEGMVWEALVRWRAEGRCFALLTVVDTRGFTPQKSGAHMLVARDGETCGTVGGGAIEHEALTRARELLAAGVGASLVRKHLTQELGMCCGGEMAVFVEVVEAAPQLIVFGAGYIAKPLAALAAGCGFVVTVVDQRPEWADAARFPNATVRCQAPEDFLRAESLAPGHYAVVVTHDHALDQRIVQLLLARPLRFVGMIGSIPKQRKFALRLRARGFSDEQIARLKTPLGVPIGAKSPEEIAVSVLAELIAVRRGKPLGEGWVPRAGVRDEMEGERDRAGDPAPAATEVPARAPDAVESVAPDPLGAMDTVPDHEPQDDFRAGAPGRVRRTTSPRHETGGTPR